MLRSPSVLQTIRCVVFMLFGELVIRVVKEGFRTCGTVSVLNNRADTWELEVRLFAVCLLLLSLGL